MKQKKLRSIDRCDPSCGHQGRCRFCIVPSDGRCGRLLRKGTPASTQPRLPVWPRPSELAGSDNAAVCLFLTLPRPPLRQQGDTFASPSVSRSHWQLPVEKVLGRLPGSSVDRHRRSRGSCGKTLQPVAAALNTEPTRRSGMSTAQRCVRSLPSC